MGELKDPDTGDRMIPRALVGTQYLPSLRGAFWSDVQKNARLELDLAKKTAHPDQFIDNTEQYFAIDADLQRAIKRTKIGVQLLEKKSDPKSKYDLFQRLNSGGLAANDQEIRNCAIVMVNPHFFAKMKSYAESEQFSKLIPLGRRSIEKSNHLENLSKIIAFSFKNYKAGTDIEEFVTNALVDLASLSGSEIEAIFDIIVKAVNLLVESCGINALRPYREGKFLGRIGRTSVEIILCGLIKCLDNVTAKPNPQEFVLSQVKSFWKSEE